MDNNIEILISLYAVNDIAILESCSGGTLFENAYGRVFTDFYNEGWFVKGKEIVSGYKKMLDKFGNQAATSQDQIKLCLNHVWGESFSKENNPDIFDRNMAILKRLTLAKFTTWNKEQVDYYATNFDIYVESPLYFLSYTNRNPQVINMKYRYFCKSILQNDDMQRGDVGKRNFIAKAIVDKLNQRNLKKGFFDRYSLRHSQNVQDEVINNVKKSITFVQLISASSLSHDQTNWCFTEYDEYDKSRKSPSTSRDRIVFFIQLEKEAIPNVFPDDYQNWRDDILGNNHFCFYEIKDNDLDGFEKFINKLANEITVFSKTVLTHIPN